MVVNKILSTYFEWGPTFFVNSFQWSSRRSTDFTNPTNLKFQQSFFQTNCQKSQRKMLWCSCGQKRISFICLVYFFPKNFKKWQIAVIHYKRGHYLVTTLYLKASRQKFKEAMWWHFCFRYASVYARVTRVMPWIISIIRKGECGYRKEHSNHKSKHRATHNARGNQDLTCVSLSF